MSDLNVLYEDNHLIAVYKNAGSLVQGDETGDPTLMDEVKYYLKNKYSKTGKVFLGLIHRLDRPVSGVVLFAKTSKGAERVSKQFREHTIKKVYHALVEGHVEKSSGTLIHYLKKDEKENVTTVYESEIDGALYAELSYSVVEERGRNTLLRIELKTGRSHQIRSQLSYIGHPIVGDVKYGSETSFAQGRGIALSATELSFETATGGERKEIRVEIPF